MAEMTFVLADKNYCLWPLPAWLCLRHAGFEFEEVLIRFRDPDRRAKMLEYGPTGRVPVLHHNGLVIWDSLAICDYVADLAPDAQLWPQDRAARAMARSFACEMHATGGSYPGAVRHIIFSLDTNVRRRTDPVVPEPEVQAAIDYLIEGWRRLRTAHGSDGPFMCGQFSIADAMSAHLVNRLTTYAIAVPEDIAAYMQAVRSLPAMQRWITEAEAEDWILPSAEIDVIPPAA
ncbi:glutathione S-transferase family protein [Puniceibacterium sp. IMCC21224]|uniref:glutathione S-transferase family protein n=1 Tax=Puniceibacterium sp. IMCC21224 TaxID=1618204 RepID=UPI00064DB3BC|nr:glutathione S-transferase [Puniceibacterium sp. IMCC21224]KMK66835.1 glutathione S-transferase [Puniceibacterium sp. IMCC21224]